ncbi:MAG: ShlB/FhaC/HecB family hemolysin secretion/activation protein [Cyanobacteria bacterium]|nr:ShlB/FhaC/HecB family hemolysin secretion/activation protein [Cyanobacteria bacterium CG_2015-16_32_12]NCO78958.1 ShlB/FhaC/HecB family hemolysin secretion/activation protein [Cyanobacteria bacterium CG_2015-22_32_23]NCQ03085.1 ShlB/FhaC/HecB family hemolysin secretion/activation protein [Cyanobacteria bacterium CG_2015-09_32_10]NCQ42225.1 ShlB/FhaC/HecB family hemolysin secretion/activation protein [Cyanobacteria bacterium CG_2015-04_32_10]NCS83744.1 ShlB/FhaC/HecB family hemolysin secretio
MAKNNYKKTLLLSLSSFSFSPLFSILPVFANNFNTKIQSENITLSANILDNQYSFKKPTFITQNNSSEVYIKSIEVKGNSIFNNEINTIIEPYKNQNITNETLANISAQITQLYLNQGYITTRAIVENIVDDVAIIQVNEGQIEAIEIEGASRLENYVRQRISLGTKTPLNSGNLEDQLRLLKTDPLIENIEASLKQGNSEKQSILVVKVTEANPFFATVGIDNYSPPSIGGTQMTLAAGYGNVLGLGDSFSVSYQPRLEDWAGTYNLDLGYTIPLNAMNGTLQARVSIQENTVVEGDFQELDISGESQYYELTYRQPLIRTPREEFALSLGMSYRNGQTFTFQGPTPFGIGPNDDGITRTNVISFGQDYVKRETLGAWALRSQFRLGVGLFDVTTSNQANDPDGYFLAWLGQIQRVQLLNPDNLLIVQGDIQLSFDPLLPSEQFVIGGGQSVRGYRQNVRAGDNGFRFSIEDRITIVRNEERLPVFQVAPFFDMGSVWNVQGNPNFSPNQRFIAALGLGLIWQPIENLNMRIDYAPPLIDLIDRGNNIQDDGLYFNVKYNF